MKEEAPKLKKARAEAPPPVFKLDYGVPAKDQRAGSVTANEAGKLGGALTGADGKTS